ncbi:hypothetical protein L7F22_066358 [Adiantum nelumboides]|nr:hypothetical protein [Adiantum nelumboides]
MEGLEALGGEELEGAKLVEHRPVRGVAGEARLLKDYFQASLLHVNFKIVNVSPLERGFFRLQFEFASQAMEVLAQGSVDFYFAIGFLARWTQGMDLNVLDGGTAVTVRFPGLLPEFSPHVNEIGRCMGFVVGDAAIPEDEDRTISIRMVLYPYLAKNPPQFISLPTIHGGEILQRVFFIGLPGHYFVCGRKGHVAAACTRRRISLDQRQQASKQEALHVNGGLEDRLVRRRSEAEKARRKEGKKRRRRARKTDAPKLVYRQRENVSPLPSYTISSSSPLHDPPPNSQGTDLDISSSFEGINSAYERHFPSLVEVAKKSAEEKFLKTSRRSSRLNP